MGEIFRKSVDNSSNWVKCGGGLSCIAVTDNNYLWGCNKKGEIFTARADAPATRMGWQLVSGKCKQVAASTEWVYITNKSQDIFRKPTDNSSGREKCSGGLSSISVSDSG